MIMESRYSFNAKVWIYPGVGSWHFVTLPQETTDTIDFYFSHLKRGWGSLPVKVRVGESEWRTSIFPDKKSRSYILPLKAKVRTNETIKVGDTIAIDIVVTS